MHEIKNPLAVIEQALQRYSSADEADADALKSAASEPASSYPQMGAYAQPEQVAQSIDTQPDAQARDDARRGERSDAQARGGAHRGAQSGAQSGGGAQSGAQARDGAHRGERSDAQARDGAHRGAQSGAQAGDGVRRGAQSGAQSGGGAQSGAQAGDGAHRGAQSGAPAVGGVRGGVAHAQPNAGDRTDAQSGAPAKTAGATGINRQDWNNEFIPLLIRQISRMVAIVHSTRNLLPNRLPEQDNIDLLAHLREVIEDLGQPQRDDGSAIWFDLDTSALAALTVHFDPTHLSQIISNLIRNSIDHAQVDPGELHINITGRHAGNFIELEYWDNGIGIDAHKREHIWKAFYSSDHEHAGLGLHISNELCQINGATLEYISLAVPARFRLSLPNAH
nr:hypothetical protein [Pseudomonadota bacterium]